ncbi:MAG: hypothetical protein ACK417_11335 [Bacteroidia bacterium]
MRNKLIALLVLASLHFGCKKDQVVGISYPAEGPFGPNVLAEGRTEYPRDLCFEAYLGDDNHLLVRFIGETAFSRFDTVGQSPSGIPLVTERRFGIWTWIHGNQHNVLVSNFEGTTFMQNVESIENRGRVLHRMRFEKGHTYRIEIFENNASSPTRVKRISIE